MSDHTPVELNLSVTFRHTESTAALKSYAEEKLTHCLEKYLHGPADVHMILSVEKRDHTAEVTLHSKSYDIVATGTTTDLYAAIDKVIDNLATQLRKKKEKIQSHKLAAVNLEDSLGLE
jgi:putative sigma-54 modulation protein